MIEVVTVSLVQNSSKPATPGVGSVKGSSWGFQLASFSFLAYRSLLCSRALISVGMLSCSALLSLDSSRDIVSESQISPSLSLPSVVVVLPRGSHRLEATPAVSPYPDGDSKDLLLDPSEEVRCRSRESQD